MDDPRSAFQRMMIQGMLGVRNNEAPPVPAPVAGGGYDGSQMGQRLQPQGGMYAQTPLQLGGLFGSSNTTTIADPRQQQAMMMLLLLMGQQRPNQPTGYDRKRATEYYRPEDWVQFEDGSSGPPY